MKRFERALVVGAGHGLGLALVQELLARDSRVEVLATYRREEAARPLRELSAERLETIRLDPLEEKSMAALAARLRTFGPLDLIVNAIGFLHDESRSPEKALAEITLDHLRHAFDVNAFVTPLLAKTVKPFVTRRGPSSFVALSAKVGSIGDNRLGGWHSYRASKAALNMFVKNIALEFRNGGLREATVLAIHPGTTQTDLSRPFAARVKHQVRTPRESAGLVLETIEKASSEMSGAFLNWDGSPLPW